ncbi:MAG: menH [Myxococcaceae bacterium]|nr:menH [Myxococcaceae bacterium]
MIGWLHGFLGAPAQWDGVREEGEAWWLPGHGPSPRVRPGAGFAEVVDALSPWTRGRRVLVGYSLGARLALALALRHPGDLRAVVLVGGTPGLEDAGERAQRVAADDALAATIARDGLDAFVDRWEALPLFATQRALPPEVLAAQRTWRAQHAPEGIAWALSTLSTGRMPPLWDALATAGVAVHAVAGERDEKFTRIAEEMVRRGEGRVVHHRVAGAGHNVALENPAAVARVVRTATG